MKTANQEFCTCFIFRSRDIALCVLFSVRHFVWMIGNDASQNIVVFWMLRNDMIIIKWWVFWMIKMMHHRTLISLLNVKKWYDPNSEMSLLNDKKMMHHRSMISLVWTHFLRCEAKLGTWDEETCRCRGNIFLIRFLMYFKIFLKQCWFSKYQLSFNIFVVFVFLDDILILAPTPIIIEFLTF